MNTASSYRSTGLDPRAGALVLVLFIGAALFLPGDLRLPALGLLPFVTGLVTGTGRMLLRKLRLVFPMILVLAVLVSLRAEGETKLFSLFGAELHLESVRFGVVTGLRLLLIATAGILYTLVFPLDRITTALQRLHVPDRVVSVLWLAQRLLEILKGDAGRMMDCIRARSASLSLSARLRTSARIGGTFLLRAVERSERLGDAMAVRGFSGSIPLQSAMQWQMRDSVIALFSLILFVVLCVIP